MACHGEAVIRLLSGKGNFVGVQRGYEGNQQAEDVRINMAIPNDKER